MLLDVFLHFLNINHAFTINVYVDVYYPKRYFSRYSNVALTGRWTSTVTSLLTKMDSVVQTANSGSVKKFYYINLIRCITNVYVFNTFSKMGFCKLQIGLQIKD